MSKSIILFDGVCNLCDKSIQFILKRDHEQKFMFASLQGEKGQEILQRFGMSRKNLSSFVLVDKGNIYTRSTAVLRTLKSLGGGWKLLYGLIIIPPFLRNALYDFIAKNRYKWFGKKEECRLPTPELKARFLD